MSRTRTRNTLVYTILTVMTGAIVLASLISASAAVKASSSLFDEFRSENSLSDDEFTPETCKVTLKDDYMIEVTRWYEDAPTCEQQQLDYANMTYAEYQEFATIVNEAREKLGEMFTSDNGE